MKTFNAKSLYWITCVSLFFSVGFYIYRFHSFSLSSEPESWGQFGDYIGGLLNPLAALLNVYVTIVIAREVSKFGERQTQQQLAAQAEMNKQQVVAQKELVKNELLHQIISEFKKDMLNAHAEVSEAIEDGNALGLKPSVKKAYMVMERFIKYYESLFFVPPGFARNIATDYQKWLVPLNQGLNDADANHSYDLKIKENIDILISLLYSSIIEDAKRPEKKPVPKEVMDYWEKRLADLNVEPLV